jgi:hypothetical protein
MNKQLVCQGVTENEGKERRKERNGRTDEKERLEARTVFDENIYHLRGRSMSYIDGP